MNVSIVNCLNLPCFAQIAQKFITYCFTVMLIKLLSFSLLSCGQICNLCTTNSFVYVCLFYELVPNPSLLMFKYFSFRTTERLMSRNFDEDLWHLSRRWRIFSSEGGAKLENVSVSEPGRRPVIWFAGNVIHYTLYKVSIFCY